MESGANGERVEGGGRMGRDEAAGCFYGGAFPQFLSRERSVRGLSPKHGMTGKQSRFLVRDLCLCASNAIL